MPWGIRAVLGYDRKLCADAVSAFIAEVSRSLRHRAKREIGLASVSLAVLPRRTFGSSRGAIAFGQNPR